MAPVVSLLLASLVGAGGTPSIVDGRLAVDAESLARRTFVELGGQWRYQDGDNLRWSDPGFDDSGWGTRDPTTAGGRSDAWEGVGWFRARLVIPEALVGQPMALWVTPIGALEVYVDGRRVYAHGDPGAREDAERLPVRLRNIPVNVVFLRSEVLVAIRLAASPRLVGAMKDSLCDVGLGLGSKVVNEAQARLQVVRLYWFFVGLSFALGLLHLLLFFFLPERKENLQYAVTTWALCVLSVTVEAEGLEASPTYALFTFALFKICLLVLVIFGTKFYHAVLGERPGRFFYAYVVVGVFIGLSALWVPRWVVYLYAVYGLIEQVRLALLANVRRMQDAWLLAVAVAMSATGGLLQMVPSMLGYELPIDHAYIYGFLSMLVLMSAYQARGFARTYRDLQQRLADVRRLSEERVEQAQKIKSEEMARVRLEEENKRQSVELKEAARRQEMMAQLEATNRKLKETQAQLVQSEKMASLGNLVAGIAHEINTPVGAIKSMHDSLAKATDRLKVTLQTEKPELIEENRRIKAALKVIDDASGVIESGSSRVANIVRRLKSFARLDEAELLCADVHEGLDDTLLLLQHELKRDIKVHRDYGDVPPFSCFPSQLNQVYLNLLVNARQAVDGAGEIFIRTRVVNGQAHISIRDTGRGIPKQNLNKIFDPGFTTKGVQVGTGLGLSICYRIVSDHQGRILVDSEEGRGSTFTVVLPLDLDQRKAAS